MKTVYLYILLMVKNALSLEIVQAETGDAINIVKDIKKYYLIFKK